MASKGEKTEGANMAATLTGSWWDYSRWTKNLARNARITEPDPTKFESWVYRVLVANICWPAADTGTRPWLMPALRRLAQGGAAKDDYNFNPITEPMSVVIKAVEIIGRDFKKIPITEVEKQMMDSIFALTNNRRFGTKPLYGNVGGSVTT